MKIEFENPSSDWGIITGYVMCLSIPNRIEYLAYSCKKKRTRKKYQKLIAIKYRISEKFN